MHPRVERRVEIPGPEGFLEAVVSQTDAPAAEAGVLAILCHPHPQYGGSMDDAVLGCAESALLKHHINCLRFNFRGVGASAGHTSGGEGEPDDLKAVIGWARAELKFDQLWLGGYSFGANMVWRVLATEKADHTLLIAPPVGFMAFEAGATGCDSIAVIAGDADDFINQTALKDLPGVNSTMIPGANHFFMGQFEALTRSVESIATHWLQGS